MLETRSFPLTTTQKAPVGYYRIASGVNFCKFQLASQRLSSHRSKPCYKNAHFDTMVACQKLQKVNSLRCTSQSCSMKTNKKRPFLVHNTDKGFSNGRIIMQMQERMIIWISSSLQQFSGVCNSACVSILFIGSIMLFGCSSNPAIANPTMEPHVILKNNDVELLPIPEVFYPLKALPLPAFEKVILPNGLRVFLLEDHELGLVGGQILARGGSKDDFPGKVGLATITSSVQRSGGTIQHPEEALDTILEEIAARIETYSGVSEMSVGFRCLSEDLKEVMPLFFEVIQNPLMPQDKLDFVRTQLLSSIERRGDNPGGIASREFSKILYGDKSAYSSYFTENSLKSINQEDLVAFHKTVFSPKSSVLGIWGDFDTKMVKDILNDLSSWNAVSDVENSLYEDKKSDLPFQDLESGISNYRPDTYIVDKPGLTQGFVRMGELGTTIVDPDAVSLDVLNEILNGFGGLLFDQIRSKEGLAYSVYGGWSPAFEHRGAFLAGGETQISTVPQLINSIERVLQDVTHQPPSEETLKKAKERIINSFVFNFADSGVQLSRIMTYDLFGIDQNYIFDFKKKVGEVTSMDILDAAKRHLHPGEQPILVVVDASKISSSLQKLGKQVVFLRPDYLR